MAGNRVNQVLRVLRWQSSCVGRVKGAKAVEQRQNCVRFKGLRSKDWE